MEWRERGTFLLDGNVLNIFVHFSFRKNKKFPSKNVTETYKYLSITEK